MMLDDTAYGPYLRSPFGAQTNSAVGDKKRNETNGPAPTRLAARLDGRDMCVICLTCDGRHTYCTVHDLAVVRAKGENIGLGALQMPRQVRSRTKEKAGVTSCTNLKYQQKP